MLRSSVSLACGSPSELRFIILRFFVLRKRKKENEFAETIRTPKTQSILFHGVTLSLPNELQQETFHFRSPALQAMKPSRSISRIDFDPPIVSRNVALAHRILELLRALLRKTKTIQRNKFCKRPACSDSCLRQEDRSQLSKIMGREVSQLRAGLITKCALPCT